MEALVATALPACIALCKVFLKLQARLETASDNPRLANRLARRFDNIRDTVARLLNACHNNTMRVSDTVLRVYEGRIHAVDADIRSLKEELVAMENRLSRRRFRLRKVNTVSTWLAEQDACAEKVETNLMEIAKCFTLAETRISRNKLAEVSLSTPSERLSDSSLSQKHTSASTLDILLDVDGQVANDEGLQPHLSHASSRSSRISSA